MNQHLLEGLPSNQRVIVGSTGFLKWQRQVSALQSVREAEGESVTSEAGGRWNTLLCCIATSRGVFLS